MSDSILLVVIPENGNPYVLKSDNLDKFKRLVADVTGAATPEAPVSIFAVSGQVVTLTAFNTAVTCQISFPGKDVESLVCPSSLPKPSVDVLQVYDKVPGEEDDQTSTSSKK